MNLVMLMGRLTTDPKINDMITCASFILAVDRSYKKDGEQNADFIPCKMLGDKKADFANRYLRKGKKVAVTGEIQTGSYTGKDGKKVYTTDVIVKNIEFAESRAAQRENEQEEKQGQQNQTAGEDFMSIPDNLDDVPFA